MDALVVANASAGSADDEAVAAAVDALGAGAELVRSGGPDDLDRALDRLDGRVLVVAGGDGSLHLVVQRLYDRGELAAVTLGLVPLGTGNDFARGAGVPLDPVAAAHAIGASADHPHSIDLIVDDEGEVVANVAHAGLGAEAAERSSKMKGTLGPLAYPVGALLAGVQERGWALDVLVDGQPVGEGSVLMVGVGNGRTIGGGTPLCPDAVLDDGLLDVVVVNATGAAARAAFGAALRHGTHLERDDVHHGRGQVVAISGDPVRHNADGELSDEVADRRYRVLAAAWSMLGSDTAEV